MTVHASERKESKFEVFDHWRKTEKELTILVIRDFGFMPSMIEKRREKILCGRKAQDMTYEQLGKLNADINKDMDMCLWYCQRRREKVLDTIDEVTRCIRCANAMYPRYQSELVQRRLLQDEAIGYVQTLLQYLQATAEALPIDKNKFARFGLMLDKEITLLKGWRKSDCKFKDKVLPG